MPIATNSVVQLRSSSAYTVATWVKVEGTLIGFILFHGEGCSMWGSWFLGVGGGEGDAARQPGKLVFGVRESNGSGYTSVAAPLAPDKWVHVAATYDGTTLTLYIDGKQVATVWQHRSRTTTPIASTSAVIRAVADASGSLG